MTENFVFWHYKLHKLDTVVSNRNIHAKQARSKQARLEHENCIVLVHYHLWVFTLIISMHHFIIQRLHSWVNMTRVTYTYLLLLLLLWKLMFSYFWVAEIKNPPPRFLVFCHNLVCVRVHREGNVHAQTSK